MAAALFLRNVIHTSRLIGTPSIRMVHSPADTVHYLEIPGNPTIGPERRLAYRKTEGKSGPGVVLIPGFNTHGNNSDAKKIRHWCQQREVPCITYDPVGYGDTECDVHYSKCNFPYWVADAEQVLTRLTVGPQVIAGSSMGGLIAGVLAQKVPARTAALLLLSPAVNFASAIVDRVEKHSSKADKEKFFRREIIEFINPQADLISYVSLRLVEEVRSAELSSAPRSLDIHCPVRILYSNNDTVVPPEMIVQLFSSFRGDDVHLKMLRSSQHFLNEPETLVIIEKILQELLQHPNVVRNSKKI